MSGGLQTFYVPPNEAINFIASGGPVSLHLLRDVLKLAEMPNQLLVFNNPKLASACIKHVEARSQTHS
ncbi:hypothetical protein FRC07_010872, partial [Ceratobasidium sp. 392]